MLQKTIKQLAKSGKYQSLYSKVKEIGSMRLFNNNSDFSAIQLMFMDWLEIYHSLYTDLAMGEEFINEEVIIDDIRTEAYLLYRSEKRKKKETKKQENEINKKITSGGLSSVIFNTKRK